MVSGSNLEYNVEADSSFQDGSAFVCIGKIHRSHGIHGEVVFRPLTDFPERIQAGKTVFIGREYKESKIQQVRQKPPHLLIKFLQYHTETEVSALVNTFVYVRKESLPELPEGEYYFHQLIGLDVVNEQDDLIGKLKEILETGANDVYVIEKTDGSEELIAAIPQVVVKIDLTAQKIIIRPPDWYET
jgi:16S rRNA processing protein RimM